VNDTAGRTVDDAVASGDGAVIILYAVWGQFTITYHLDGGENAPGSPLVYSEEDTLVPLLAPEKTGFTFGGWYERTQVSPEPPSPPSPGAAPGTARRAGRSPRQGAARHSAPERASAAVLEAREGTSASTARQERAQALPQAAARPPSAPVPAEPAARSTAWRAAGPKSQKPTANSPTPGGTDREPGNISH